MGVQPRVIQLLGRERALAPIGALVPFVDLDGEVIFEQRRQPGLRPAERARGGHGVEQVGELEAVVAFEAEQVIFGGVEDFLLLRVGEERPQGRGIGGQRIHDVIGARRGELNQTDALPVGKQAVGFGVHCQRRLGGQRCHQPRHFGIGLDEARRGERAGHTAPHYPRNGL